MDMKRDEVIDSIGLYQIYLSIKKEHKYQDYFCDTEQVIIRRNMDEKGQRR